MSVSPAPTHHTEQLAVGAKQLGTMLGLSERTIRQLDAGGKLPRPVKIGARSVRWPVDEVRDWLAAGCPDRPSWEAIRKNGRPPR